MLMLRTIMMIKTIMMIMMFMMLMMIQTAPGAGPRHLVLHPSLPLAFLACELQSRVQVSIIIIPIIIIIIVTIIIIMQIIIIIILSIVVITTLPYLLPFFPVNSKVESWS